MKWPCGCCDVKRILGSRPQPLEINGKEYPSQEAAAKAYGMGREMFQYRLYRQTCLNKPVQPNGRKRRPGKRERRRQNQKTLCNQFLSLRW